MVVLNLYLMGLLSTYAWRRPWESFSLRFTHVPQLVCFDCDHGTLNAIFWNIRLIEFTKTYVCFHSVIFIFTLKDFVVFILWELYKE